MAIGTFIRDSLNKLSARVTYARNGVSALSVKIEDMNVDNFSIPVVPGVFGEPKSEFLKTSGGSSDMNVDGSVTAVEFSISPDTDSDWLIDELYFSAQDGSVKASKFFGTGVILSNGVLLEVKANNIITTRTFTTTHEFLEWASAGAWSERSDAGGDSLKASYTGGILLRKSGTFGPVANDDYIKATVQDDITSVVQFRSEARGVLRNV